MPTSILTDLNPVQQKAILHTDGPMLILAGAGSGKTRVLTHKVAYLIAEKNISDTAILMLTFTNKAANEMKERIKLLLKKYDRHSLPFAGTFHALCAKLLRIEGKHIGLSPNFVIYDSQDQKDAIKAAMNYLNISQKQYHPGSILGTISEAKNELITSNQYVQYARGTFQTLVSTVYQKYQQILKENQALDFDDLLMTTVELFKTVETVRNKYQKQFQYLLVDEYQDTNTAQYELTKLLSAQYKNICVVGDASQSIYAWRGANFRNILQFKSDFPDAKIFHLEQNYRSTQNILDAAFSVISKNISHPILKLWTNNPSGNRVSIFEARTEQHEALSILSEIEKKRHAFPDVAVLYRTNAQSRTIEEVLLHEGIPYVLVGGVSFYQRKEIKDVLSYLRLILNPQDTIARDRIEKIGKKRAEKFGELLQKPFIDQDTLTILEIVLRTTGYIDLYSKDDPEDLARLENIKELRSVAQDFPKLPLFLENVSLMEAAYRPQKNTDPKQALTLMTMHAAKGLEYPAVFMVGMEEGLFPHSRALLSTEELEEERRLCYVGITRAKEHLYLTYARRRLYFGTRTNNLVSRFLAEIPENLLETNLSNDDYFE